MSWAWAFVPSLKSFHLISWGALLGAELYQSIVVTKLAFLHLPRPQFVQLQSNLFPVYFSVQTGLVLLTAATYPPYSLRSLLKGARLWSAQVPLVLNLVMALLNVFVYGPRTRSIMLRRMSMGEKEGVATNGLGGVLVDWKKMNRDFSHNHEMAIHLNFLAMVGTVWYGLGLASKMKFDV